MSSPLAKSFLSNAGRWSKFGIGIHLLLMMGEAAEWEEFDESILGNVKVRLHFGCTAKI
jgi:hypothetical protein